MGISEKLMEALRSGILMNERLSVFMTKVDRIDEDMRKLNERLIRIETMMEIAQARLASSGHGG